MFPIRNKDEVDGNEFINANIFDSIKGLLTCPICL